jgi:hypothetical protein
MVRKHPRSRRPAAAGPGQCPLRNECKRNRNRLLSASRIRGGGRRDGRSPERPKGGAEEWLDHGTVHLSNPASASQTRQHGQRQTGVPLSGCPAGKGRDNGESGHSAPGQAVPADGLPGHRWDGARGWRATEQAWPSSPFAAPAAVVQGRNQPPVRSGSMDARSRWMAWGCMARRKR